LNAQELRNAEFFGLFKTTAYELATEQLNRWRDWGIFTPDQISRMNEVELTSEFMIMALSGILYKDNKTIDKFYEEYDDSFGDRNELSKRIRIVFDTIDSAFEHDQLQAFFGGRTIFFSLFTTIYSWHFGLRSADKNYSKLSIGRPKKLRRRKYLE
jgi:hypothetical protein